MLFDEGGERFPGYLPIHAFRALALFSAGRFPEAVFELIAAMVASSEVNLYLVAIDPQMASMPAMSATIEIVGGGANGALFSLVSLTVSPGTQVT